MVFDALLDPIFSPLLKMSSLWAIALISLIISVLITVIYKYVTDQDLMKRLKTEMKDFQKEIKELKAHPEKAMAVQKKAMETNMKYMMHSFRPTLITIIPIILIFGWMNAHIAYEPISPDQSFNINIELYEENGIVNLEAPTLELLTNSTQKAINKEASWMLKGEEGKHVVTIIHNDHTATKEVIIGNEYATPMEKPSGKDIKYIEIEMEKRKIIPIFGGISWFWSYIIFSLVFSTSLRKLLKIY